MWFWSFATFRKPDIWQNHSRTTNLGAATHNPKPQNTLKCKDLYNNKDKKMERMMGFEPTTSTLARLRSTPELHPLWMTGCLAASVWQKIYMGIRIWQDFFREKSVFFPGSCLKITVCRVADGSSHIYQRHLEGRGRGVCLSRLFLFHGEPCQQSVCRVQIVPGFQVDMNE